MVMYMVSKKIEFYFHLSSYVVHILRLSSQRYD